MVLTIDWCDIHAALTHSSTHSIFLIRQLGGIFYFLTNYSTSVLYIYMYEMVLVDSQ